MTFIEKKMNKRLIGLLIGGTILGAGLYKNKKNKSFFTKIKNFLFGGIKELKKELKK